MLLLFLIAFSSLAIAEDGVILQKGQKAPYAGVLLTSEAIAKIRATSDGELARCIADGKRDLKLAKADSNFQIASKEAKLASCTFSSSEHKKMYEARISFLEKRAVQPDWVQPSLFAGGVLTGISVVVGSAWVLDKIK